MGYTLLDTLSELWFTQFFNSVLLCTCLLVSSVSFFVFQLLLSWRKSRVVFLLVFLLLLGKSRGFVSVFYTMFFLCHEHFRLCAMSTYQVLHPLRSLTGYRLKHHLTTPLGHCFVTEIPFRRVKLSMVLVVFH